MDAETSKSSEEENIHHDSSPFDTHQHLFDVVHYIDEAHYASSMIFAIIGVVFNVLLMAVVIFSKELHVRRILIWLGIGMSNILVLSSHVLLSQSVVLESSSSERSLCYWYAILSIVVQMFNVFYAALERHICINYPKWHKTAVFSTISIILVQVSSYIPIFLVLGILNINNFQELAFEYWYFRLVASFFFGLIPLCLCGQIVLAKTKTNRDEPSVESGNQQPHLNSQKPENETTSKSSVVVPVGNNQISQLDIKAAQNFYFFAKLLLIFTALKLIPFIHIYCCLDNKQGLSSENQASGSEAECFSVIKAFYFICALLNCFYSSIANPAAFLFFTLIKEGRPG